MAVKRIKDQGEHKVEFENLVNLRKCLSDHERIMAYLAAFHNTVDDSNFIIYELAAYDLEKFLRFSPGLLREERHAPASPEKMDSKNIWPGNLLLESSDLVDALDYLHERLLAHNDIKPDNILVVYPDSYNLADRYPAGKWKLADFGISKIQDKRTPTTEKHLSTDLSSKTHRELSIAKTKPGSAPRSYTAPELDQDQALELIDARKADIWSFGCMLSEVVAYAVQMHPHLVSEFRSALEEGYKDPKFYDPNTKDVKPNFSKYLATLPDQVHQGPRQKADNVEWVKQCVELVKKIVVKDTEARPDAGTIRIALLRIEEEMSKDRGLWLPQESTDADLPNLHLDTSVTAENERYPPVLGSVSEVDSPEKIEGPMRLDAAGQVGMGGLPTIVISYHAQDKSLTTEKAS